MTKRQRIDSATAAVRIMGAATSVELEPPEHISVPEGAVPFWNAIMRGRARADWLAAPVSPRRPAGVDLEADHGREGRPKGRQAAVNATIDQEHDVAALRARIVELQAENAWLRCGATAMDIDLVAAIGRAVGDDAVTSREIACKAATSAELDIAAIAAMGVDWTVKKLGWRLLRVQGQDLGGFVVTQVGGERDGRLWTVKPTLRLSAASNALTG